MEINKEFTIGNNKFIHTKNGLIVVPLEVDKIKPIGESLQEHIDFWHNEYNKKYYECEELKHINEQHRILNGELREEINQLKKQKQKILDYISEE